MIVLAFFFSAFWEMAAEGPNGGAATQHGWKIDFGLGEGFVLKQYHFFLWYVTVPLFLIVPIVAAGFDKKLICIVLMGYFVGIIVEDFSWVVLNPFFGVEKFSPEYITWNAWTIIGAVKIPTMYIVWSIGAIVSFIVFLKLK